MASAIFYFAIATITAYANHLAVKANQKSRSIMAWISVLIPAIFAGIRYGIGTDYFVTYKPYFNYLAGIEQLELNRRDNLEIGYYLLNELVIKLHGNFQMVLFLSSVITFIVFRKAILVYKDRLHVGLATFVLMLLYYQTSLNIVRQMIAAPIILYAFHFIEEKNPKKFTFWVLVATLFHTTAIVALPFYIFINYFIQKKSGLFISTVYLILILAVFNFDKFATIVNYIDPSGYYVSYFRKVSSFKLSIGLLIRTVPYIIAVFLMRFRIRGDKTMQLYLHSFLLGNIVRLIVYMTQFDADRIALYFLVPQVIFIPYLTKYYKRSWGEFIASTLLVTFVVIIWYFDFIYMGRTATIPYVTVFGGQ